MDIRKLFEAEYDKYKWNDAHDKNLKKQAAKLLSKDEEYKTLAEENVKYDAEARALDAVLAIVDSLQAGYVVGGVDIYTKLKNLQVFKDGLSVEDNIASYNSLFLSITGNEENLAIVYANKDKVLALIKPFLEKNEILRQTEFKAKLKIVKEFASTNRVPLKKGV